MLLRSDVVSSALREKRLRSNAAAGWVSVGVVVLCKKSRADWILTRYPETLQDRSLREGFAGRVFETRIVESFSVLVIANVHDCGPGFVWRVWVVLRGWFLLVWNVELGKEDMVLRSQASG
ncbi:hypothetical protein R1flu_007001 [Riccia fluitans]|uniref:Uncharacterized protein n=1 Tax=Riccia fluitans TaxID=41844 RepID=A0ABD1YXL8_9MARC